MPFRYPPPSAIVEEAGSARNQERADRLIRFRAVVRSPTLAAAERSEWSRTTWVMSFYGLLLAVSAVAILLDLSRVPWRLATLGVWLAHSAATLVFLFRDPAALRPVLPGTARLRHCAEALLCAGAAVALVVLVAAAETALGGPGDAAGGGDSSVTATYADVFLLAVLPAVMEEIAFRGLLFSALEPWLPSWKSVVVSAALFSLLHLSPIKIPLYLGLGLVLGWLRIRSGSLIPPMLMHFAYNGGLILASSR